MAMAQQYLKKLIELGASGIRLDAAKHMHPAFIEDLMRSPGIDGRLWVYAEVIADRTFDPALEAYRHVAGLKFMDFPLTRLMMESFGFGGSLRAFRYATDNGRALNTEASVSFVTNHDVWGNESGLGYRYGAFQDEVLSLIYLLGREEGVPYVYSELPGRSESRRFRPDGEDYVFFHRRSFVRQMVQFHQAQAGKPHRWAWEDDNHLAFARGSRAFVAINKSGSPWRIDDIDLLLEDGSYQDIMSGQRFTLKNGRTTGDVPARWVRVLIPVSP
jgi:alpha-amylase